MKLSIIVPIYQAENTLRRCVDSILSQSFNDYELLLIDDGSTDASRHIADEYARENNKVKTFHKENGGQSDARNYGIKRAEGEYIGFVDSDDELAPDTLAHLMKTLDLNPEYDVLEFSVLENPGDSDERLSSTKNYVYENPMKWIEENGLEHCWVWNKIFKRHIFDKTLFLKGRIYEDVYFMGDMLTHHPVIASTDKGLYMYYRNVNGTTANERRKGLGMLLEAQMHIVKKLGINTREKRWNRIYLNMLTSQLYHYKATGQLILWPQRIAIKRYGGMNDCIKAIMLDVFGLRITCLLFKWFHRK